MSEHTGLPLTDQELATRHFAKVGGYIVFSYYTYTHTYMNGQDESNGEEFFSVFYTIPTAPHQPSLPPVSSLSVRLSVGAPAAAPGLQVPPRDAHGPGVRLLPGKRGEKRGTEGRGGKGRREKTTAV